MLRCDENISKLDFENKKGKNIVSIGNFAYRVIIEINGANYLYNDLLIGAIDVVSQKYQIVCKESYKEVFDFVSNKLRELGW